MIVQDRIQIRIYLGNKAFQIFDFLFSKVFDNDSSANEIVVIVEVESETIASMIETLRSKQYVRIG